MGAGGEPCIYNYVCHEYYFTTTEIDNAHNTIHLYYGKPYLMEKQPTKYVYMKQHNYQHKFSNKTGIDQCTVEHHSGNLFRQNIPHTVRTVLLSVIAVQS